MLCVPLDNFDLILGMNFFSKTKVALLPHLRGLMVIEESMSCFVQAILEGASRKGQQSEMLSTLQSKKGLKQGLETYVVALVEIKESKTVEVLDSIVGLPHKFTDVMP